MRKLIVVLLFVFAFVSANRGLEPHIAKREAQVAALTRIVTSPVVAAPTFIPPHVLSKAAAQPLTTGSIGQHRPQPIRPALDRVVAIDLNTPETAGAAQSGFGSAALNGARSSEPLVAAQLVRPATLPMPAAWRTSVEGNAVPTEAVEKQKVLKPAAGKARNKLIRSVQRFLKSKGCYHGRIDGLWGKGSKRGMATFLRRANATLPVDQPDYVMLSLVKSRHGISCRGGCPRGQTLSRSGACIPDAILARAPRETAPVRSLASVLASDETVAEQRIAAASGYQAPTRAELPGRMSVGGPRSGDVNVAAVYPAAPVGGAHNPSGAARAQVLDETQIRTRAHAAPKPRASSKRVKKKKARSKRSYSSKRRLMSLFENPLGRN